MEKLELKPRDLLGDTLSELVELGSDPTATSCDTELLTRPNNQKSSLKVYSCQKHTRAIKTAVGDERNEGASLPLTQVV